MGKNTNILDNYTDICSEFCEYYYSGLDKNYNKLKSLYTNDSLFTVYGKDLKGFTEFVTYLKKLGINKMYHDDMDVHSQPVDNSTILISVTGTLTSNQTFLTREFSEVILLSLVDNNNYRVINTIIKHI